MLSFHTIGRIFSKFSNRLEREQQARALEVLYLKCSIRKSSAPYLHVRLAAELRLS